MSLKSTTARARLAILLAVLSVFTPASSFSNPCTEMVTIAARGRAKTELHELISALPSNAEIPANVYSRFDVNDIANAIVKRVKREESQNLDVLSSPRHVKINLQRDTDIMLFFWSEDLASINEKGFLNLHQAKKSRGIFNYSTRMQAEDINTGLTLGASQEALDLRPKSALLNVRVDVGLGNRQHPVLNHFGNIAAVMKPNIRERSLWMNTDSFFLAGNGFGPPSRAELIERRGSFDRETLPGPQVGGISYFETFIYGKVGMKDVDYFLVFDPSLVEILKPLRKPIYLGAPRVLETFANDQFGQLSLMRREIFEKKQLLFSGAAE